VGARALQGLGGAMMVPVGRLILLRTVPKAEMVDAMAWVTIPALIGPLVGPPVGGFITTYFDWRWTFWMNLPFGVFAIALATWLMPQMPRENVAPLDIKGFVLSGLGLSGAVFGLTTMGRGLMSPVVSGCMMGMGLLLLIGYVAHARVTPHPILDLRLFKIQTFFVGVCGGSLYRVGVGAIPFLLPLLLQIGFGVSAFQSGMVTCASAFGAIAMKFSAARLLRRFGFRQLLLLNGLVSCGLMAVNGLFTIATPFWLMSVIFLCAGYFRSLQFTAMNALAYSDIEPDGMSSATGLYATAQQLSLAMGVAVAAYIVEATQWFGGRDQLGAQDFTVAFFCVTGIAAVSLMIFRNLSANAGSSVSGRVIT
jgi:MFS family permease